MLVQKSDKNVTKSTKFRLGNAKFCMKKILFGEFLRTFAMLLNDFFIQIRLVGHHGQSARVVVEAV